MPAKGGAGARPRRADPDAPAPKYRRPDAALVRQAAARALARTGRGFDSQAELRRTLLPLLKRKDPAFALGDRRMRSLLFESGALAMRVRYAERADRRPLARCPVCSGPLRPIRNRTLLDDRVTLGYRCPRCGYWTHLKRRVPVRYRFVPRRAPPAELAENDPRG